MGKPEIAIVDGREYQVIRVLECDFAALLDAKRKVEMRVQELETFLAGLRTDRQAQLVSDDDGGAD